MTILELTNRLKKEYLFKQVLRFYSESEGDISGLALKNYYLNWRKENNIPYWCDNSRCILHKSNPKWHGKKIRLEIDHIDNVNRNWRHKNLRLLCPNCYSQNNPVGHVMDSHWQKNYKLSKDCSWYAVGMTNNWNNHFLSILFWTLFFIVRKVDFLRSSENINIVYFVLFCNFLKVSILKSACRKKYSTILFRTKKNNRNQIVRLIQGQLSLKQNCYLSLFF